MSEHELWNELGNLYFLGGQYQQAVHAYRRSIQLDVTFGRPYSNLALTYVQQGKYAEAIELYRQSIELLMESREKALSWNRLGNVFRYLKDYPQAVLAYRHADELDPESRDDADAPGLATEPSTASAAAQVVTTDVPLAISDPLEPTAEAAGSDSVDDREATSTWAPMDPSLFQQDVFEALEPGTLTTWGDSGADVDDPDANWPPEPGTEISYPEIDSGELSKWLQVPEEQPIDELEYTLEAVDLAAEAEEAFAGLDDDLVTGLFGDILAEPPDPIATREQSEDATVTADSAGIGERADLTTTNSLLRERTEAAIIVEERPASGAHIETGVEQPSAVMLEETPARAEVRMPEASPDAPSTSESLRDPDEWREIEVGLEKFLRVVEVNPKNARAWDTLGNLYKSAGRYDDALAAYQQAIQHDPSKALFHHHLAIVYAWQGRLDEAVDALQTVIRINPDHGLAHAALGGYYRKKGLEELAQKHIGMAMKSVFDSENEYNRACLAAICGDVEQALELLRVALSNKQTYVDWILRDPDLDFIRQDPRFKQLISDYAR